MSSSNRDEFRRNRDDYKEVSYETVVYRRRDGGRKNDSVYQVDRRSTGPLIRRDDDHGRDSSRVLSRRRQLSPRSPPDSRSSSQRESRHRPSSDRRENRRSNDDDDRGSARRGNQTPADSSTSGRNTNSQDATQEEDSNNSKTQGYESDESSESDIVEKRKNMKAKEILIGSLATVATIHAASNIFSSLEAHEKRKEMVEAGDMSPEEAKKIRHKKWVHDAAAVGIAAMSIRGALSEWKEVKEHRAERNEVERHNRKLQKKRNRAAEQEEKDRQERLMTMMSGYNGSSGLSR